MVKFHKYQTQEYKKKNRKDMVKIYKSIRKENPVMARLLWKRIKQCENELIEKIYDPTT